MISTVLEGRQKILLKKSNHFYLLIVYKDEHWSPKRQQPHELPLVVV